MAKNKCGVRSAECGEEAQPAAGAQAPTGSPEGSIQQTPPALSAEQLEAERRRRLELAELNRVLAHKQCTNCATVGAWIVYDRERSTGRVHYVRCKGCHNNDQVAVIVDDVAHKCPDKL